MENEFSWYDEMYADNSGIPVSPFVKHYLSGAVKWVKYVCILFCVLIPAMAIKALFLIDSFPSVFGRSHIQSLIIGQLVLPALCIFPVVWGFKFVKNIKSACRTGNQEDLERGFKALRICFFLVIIVAVLYLLFAIEPIFSRIDSYLFDN